MDNKEICTLFSKYGTLSVQASGREIEAKEATISVGDVSFSISLKPVFGFINEIKQLRTTLENNCKARIQTQYLAPGKINLKLLSD